MPSKLKKSANKTPSRLSNSDQYQSPGALPSTPSPDSEAGDEDFSLSLREASSRFPSLIGESAFVGRVVDIQHESKGCKIWLSEPSMVASSLSPGAIVSVSLAVRSNLPYGFPLCPLPGECDGLVAIDDGSSLAYEAGDYFALATVYPSSKIVKNGVRFSSSLSYTMGGLTSGRVVFVYCIQNQSVTSFGSESDNRHRSEGGSLCIYNCKELCLELAPCAIRSSAGNSLLTTMKSPIEKARCQIENGGVASPKTPVYQSRLNSLNSRESASPIYQESVSSSPKPNSLSSDSLDVNEVLRNENAKKLLETCATTWLYSRILLCGNVVSIPMFSEICTFRVIGAKKLSLHGITHELMNERSRHLFSEVPELLDQSICAFAINHQTRVVLHVPLTLASGNPQESVLSGVGHKIMDVRSKGAGAVSKLGGLSKEYAILKDIIVSSSIGDTLSSFGLRTTKGVLLHGTSGTGKTSLAQLCARDAGVNLFSVNGPEIISQYFGESEKALHEVFDSAIQAAPAVVFIDELDSIAPARKDGGEELSHRMVATLLNVMDGISRTNGLLVIAATNRPESIEPALRRPGRLDREIEIGVPSPLQRLDILLTLLSQMEHSLSKIQVQQLAMSTHGFVGADLAFLCNEAGLVCLRRFSKSKNSESKLKSERTDIPNEGCSDHTNGWSYCLKDTRDTRDTIKDSSDSESSCVSNVIIADTQSFIPLNGTVAGSSDDINNGAEDNCILKVSFEDFEKARMKVRPSAMREVILEVPKVKWEDVGGQREIKAQLIEAVEWPQKHQEAFKRIGTRPPTGILLFGPPGCSKTLMARAVASEAGLNFLAVKGPELFSKWVGESEKAVRSLFAKARANAPSIIFFDEIDGLAITRGKESDGISVSDRVMSQLLVELDGLHQRVNVTVIAATNRPDKIDPALLRPGRFDRLLYVGPPNEIDREEIFCIHLRKIACNSDINIKKLASLTRSCTGADISLICREAALAALEESLSASEITMQHLKTAIKQVVPSEVQPYHELSKKFERIVYTSREGEVGYQQCSRQSNDFSLWSPLKFVGLVLHRIWTIISLSKSVSDG